MVNLEEYKTENNLNLVIDIVSIKSINFIDTAPLLHVSDIKYEEEACRFRVLEFFNLDEPVSNEVSDLFIEENKIISNMKNVVRAMYMSIDSNTVIPEHMDDEDPNFRIINVIHSSSADIEKCGMFIKDTKHKMINGSIIGLNASFEPHSVWNYTDDPLIVVVIIIKQ
jgi:hypothetical protein